MQNKIVAVSTLRHSCHKPEIIVHSSPALTTVHGVTQFSQSSVAWLVESDSAQLYLPDACKIRTSLASCWQINAQPFQRMGFINNRHYFTRCWQRLRKKKCKESNVILQSRSERLVLAPRKREFDSAEQLWNLPVNSCFNSEGKRFVKDNTNSSFSMNRLAILWKVRECVIHELTPTKILLSLVTCKWYFSLIETAIQPSLKHIIL